MDNYPKLKISKENFFTFRNRDFYKINIYNIFSSPIKATNKNLIIHVKYYSTNKNLFSIFLFFQNFPVFYLIDCVNTGRKQAGRSKFLFPKFTEKIKDNITQLILDDWLLCRRICLGLGRVTHREQER